MDLPDVNSLVINFSPVLYTGTSIFKYNVLFLSEGFSAAEEKKFDNAVSNIVHHFLNISPFCLSIDYDNSLIKGCFNFFKAFIPSPSSGVSIDVLLNDAGEPETNKIKKPPYHHRMVEKTLFSGWSIKRRTGTWGLRQNRGMRILVYFSYFNRYHL